MNPLKSIFASASITQDNASTFKKQNKITWHTKTQENIPSEGTKQSSEPNSDGT